MKRTRLAAWSYATLLMFTAVTVVTGLAVTPRVEAALGAARYGAFRVVFEYGGYLGLLELGLGGSLAPLLARAAGQGDERRMRETMAAGVRVYLGVAALVVLVGLALLPWSGRLVQVPPMLRPDVHRAWLLTVLGFTLLVLSPLRALAEADQLGYRINLLMTLQAVVIAGLSLWLARSGAGAAGQVAAIVAGNVLVTTCLAVDAVRRRPGVVLGVVAVRPGAGAWRSLWSLSPPTLLMNLCSRVSLLTDYIVLNCVLGSTEPVTVLFLTQRLAVLAQTQLQGVGNAAWPGLAELHARDDAETFRRRLVELTRLVAAMGVAMLGPIVAYNHHFFDLWVPHEKALYGGDLLTAVAAVNGLGIGLMTLWTWCFLGTGQVRLILPVTVAGAAVNLVASVLLTWALGPVGPLLGTTVATAPMALWAVPRLLDRAFGASPRALAAAALGPLAWGVPYTLALYALARAHRPPGWAGLVAEMGAAALGFLALAWRALLGEADRQVWRARVAALLPGRRAHEPVA